MRVLGIINKEDNRKGCILTEPLSAYLLAEGGFYFD